MVSEGAREGWMICTQILALLLTTYVLLVDPFLSLALVSSSVK